MIPIYVKYWCNDKNEVENWGQKVKIEIEKIVSKALIDNYDKYYRIALSYVCNEEDALDVVQESAYKAIYYCDKVRNIDFIDTWICRIVINEAKKILIKRKYNEDINDDSSKNYEDDYEFLSLEDAINKLSLDEKEIIRLRFYEDMSLQQVADIKNEKISTVKSKLYRTLRKLKLSLEVDN